MGERLGERNAGAGLLDGRLEGALGELVAVDNGPVDQLLPSGVVWKGSGGEGQMGGNGLRRENGGELRKRDCVGLFGRNRDD